MSIRRAGALSLALSLSVPLSLSVASCAHQSDEPPAPSVETPPAAGSAYGFAASELTASADQLTAVALSLMGGEPADAADAAALGYAIDGEIAASVREGGPFLGLDHVELAGFGWQVFAQTTASAAEDTTVKLSVTLTPEGLFLDAASGSGPASLPAGGEIAGLAPVVERMVAAVAAGTGHEHAMTLAQCRDAVGDACAHQGLYAPLGPPHRPELFAGEILAVHAMRVGPLFRQDDGRLIAAMFRFRDVEGQAKLDGDPLLHTLSSGFHASGPPKPVPADDAGDDWPWWCRSYWPATKTPTPAATLRCQSTLLAAAYEAELDATGALVDPSVLDYDPGRMPHELSVGGGDLQAMLGHVRRLAPEPDFDTQRVSARAIELFETALARKTSVYEDVNLLTFEGPLCAALAGEPLSGDDLYLGSELSWSPLTLRRLEAAVFVGRGYQPFDPDLVAFFEGPREADDPASACLPVKPGGVVEGLREVDRTNLELLARAKM